MKLYFWQWLGVILLVIGVAWWTYDKTRPAAPTDTAPVVQPSR